MRKNFNLAAYLVIGAENTEKPVAEVVNAGTRAAEKFSTPASFKVEFLDELFKISAADVASSEFQVFNC